jgi:hypothetical protein
MDFIERWFRVSPDNGSGTAELFVLFAALAIVVSAGAVLLSRLGVLRLPEKPVRSPSAAPLRPDTSSS